MPEQKLNWLQRNVLKWTLGDSYRVGIEDVDYNTIDIKEINPTAFFGDINFSDKLLQFVFSNPALLKVISLQCDLFSLGEIYVYKNGKVVDDDQILNLFKSPNPFQTQSQWLWDFMFWTMLGNAYCYINSDVDLENNALYFLDKNKIIWPKDYTQTSDKLIFSQAGVKNLNNTTIQYKYNDGSGISFKLAKIIATSDLTNGTGDWYKGSSRIEALKKILGNADAALDSKNINIRYAGKFIVSGQQDPENIMETPLAPQERQDIESKMNGRKRVHAMKSAIDINRFVSNIKDLGLDDSYLSDYFLIGNMYNIPKDVLEASLKGTTFENQEKAVMRHVSYTLQPKGNEFMLALANRFGYTSKGLSIVMDWGHLPFMQVFEKERSEVELNKTKSFLSLLNSGVPLPEINKFLDLDFTNAVANGTGTQSGQGASQEAEGNKAEGTYGTIIDIKR